jgi:hypothetical protein
MFDFDRQISLHSWPAFVLGSARFLLLLMLVVTLLIGIVVVLGSFFYLARGCELLARACAAVRSSLAPGPRPVFVTRLAALSLLALLPFRAGAQTGVSAGYTGMHDGQRGRVLMFDYVPAGGPLDFTVGNIAGTRGRDTSFAVVSYEIVDEHLYASFGPGLITHQTSTLTSQFQFMTTFGYHKDDWSVGVRHLSNGGLQGVNIGENLVFVSWNF